MCIIITIDFFDRQKKNLILFYMFSFLFGKPQPPESHNFYYLSLLKEDDDSWSIHGFWPQYSTTSYPTYCRQVDFDITKLSKIIDKLNGIWYSTKEKNNLFWEHEWKKHGSCMFNKCDELSYFTTTLELYYKAIEKDLPEKYYNSLSKKCLIPVNLNFEFI